jgi:stearoyl-CoA desaturase (delta-9 desaturase)
MIQKFRNLHAVAKFVVLYQILLILTLPFYFYFATVQTSVVVAAVVIYFLAGLGITAGYHRFYSHKSYKAHPAVEWVIMFFGTLGTQGSIIRWSHDHRLHHAFVDTDDDPYSIKKGFWYAHMMWMMEAPKPIDKKIVKDLCDNPYLVFQDRHYLALVIGINALVFACFAWIFNDFFGAFFLILWGRMFALHHSTWFINSLAHTWGDRPFSQEQSAVNNFIISLLTFGEGYHNYHHTFANDYRNGIRWFHFDPTKWLIWSLSKLGLTSNLKMMDPASIKKRMVIEHKQLLTEQIKKLWWVKCDALQIKIDEISAQLIDKLNQWNEIRAQLKLSDSLDSELLYRLQNELKALTSSLKNDWQNWQRLSKHILLLKPLEI